jgi:hypothetical protein
MSTTMEGRQYELRSYGAGQSYAIKAIGKPDDLLFVTGAEADGFRRSLRILENRSPYQTVDQTLGHLLSVYK